MCMFKILVFVLLVQNVCAGEVKYGGVDVCFCREWCWLVLV